jgi:hypothetical protein
VKTYHHHQYIQHPAQHIASNRPNKDKPIINGQLIDCPISEEKDIDKC